jgi:hypothetical protein
VKRRCLVICSFHSVQQHHLNYNFNFLQVLTLDDVRSDPTWATTPIIVNSNHMRNAINDAVSLNFARLHGQRRFRWRTPMTGNPACYLSEANREHLYQQYPGLTSFVVHGAPALLTSNVNSALGLANGKPVEMYMLYPHKDDRQRALHLLTHSEETDIFLNQTPEYIVVRIRQPTAALNRLPGLIGCPDNQILLPIFPMQHQRSAKHRVSLGGKKFDVHTSPHGLDTVFSLTVHKIQDQTCDKLIIDLSKMPIKPPLTFQGLVALISRVRSSRHLRLLPPPAFTFAICWICALRTSPFILVSNSLPLARYDNSYFTDLLLVFCFQSGIIVHLQLRLPTPS